MAPPRLTAKFLGCPSIEIRTRRVRRWGTEAPGKRHGVPFSTQAQRKPRVSSSMLLPIALKIHFCHYEKSASIRSFFAAFYMPCGLFSRGQFIRRICAAAGPGYRPHCCHSSRRCTERHDPARARSPPQRCPRRTAPFPRRPAGSACRHWA